MHDSDDDNGATDQDEKPASSSSSSVPARFQGKTLYEVLGVDRAADSDAIKKAYRRMALSCHPDLNKSASATEEFQYLSRAHEILADKEKRRRYDLSGSVDGASGGLEDEMAAAAASGDADAYWRSIFPKISLDDIESFRARYIDSEEEIADALQAWKQNDGDLTAVFESVPFAGAESVARLCAILNKHANARITRAQQTALRKELTAQEGSEAAEAEQALQELSAKEQQIMRASMNGSASNGKRDAASSSSSSAAVAASNGETGLALIMQQRARDRERSGQSFLSNLQAKYAGGGAGAAAASSSAAAANGKKKAGSKRKGKAAAVEMEDDDDEEAEEAESNGAAHAEPSEEEFAALQAKMMAAKASKTASSAASPKKRGRK